MTLTKTLQDVALRLKKEESYTTTPLRAVMAYSRINLALPFYNALKVSTVTKFHVVMVVEVVT
jgi:hypothetical protein